MQFCSVYDIMNRIEKITFADFCYGAVFFLRRQCNKKKKRMEEKTKWRYEIMSVISMKQLLEAGVH